MQNHGDSIWITEIRTLDDIRKRQDEISDLLKKNKTGLAWSMVRILYEQTLKSIAEGRVNPAEFAKAALESF